MNGNGDYLDFRNWRNLLAYIAGIGVETLAVIILIGIGLLVVAACHWLV